MAIALQAQEDANMDIINAGANIDTAEMLRGVRTRLDQLESDEKHLRNDLRASIFVVRQAMNGALDQVEAATAKQIDTFFSDQKRPLIFLLGESRKESEESKEEVQKLQNIGEENNTKAVNDLDLIQSTIGRMKVQDLDLVQAMIGRMMVRYPAASIEKVMGDFEIGKRKVIDLKLIWKQQSACPSSIRGLDFTVTGDLVVSGKANALEVFTVDGRQRLDIKTNIKSPWQVKTDAQYIYVGDWQNGNVKKISLKGDVIQNINTYTSFGVGPVGVEVTRDRIFVAAASAKSIFSCHKGDCTAYLWSHSSVKLAAPYYLCATPNGDLVACCSASHVLTVFGPDGKLKFTYGSRGGGDGQLSSHLSACADLSGRIYVADGDNHRISVISPEGKLLTHLITESSHGIRNPSAVKISPYGDRIAVAHSKKMIALFKVAV